MIAAHLAVLIHKTYSLHDQIQIHWQEEVHSFPVLLVNGKAACSLVLVDK